MRANRAPLPLRTSVFLWAAAATWTCGPPAAPDDRQAPRATILSPSGGDTVTVGRSSPLVLLGEARDPQDGPLRGESLSWRSDVDGRLGTGDSLTVAEPSAGEHRVTLTATDSDRNTGSVAVRFVVRPPGPRVEVNPDSAVFTSLGDTVRFTAAAVDSAGNRVPDATFGWTIDDTSVARVDDDGLAAAVGNGTARITASWEGTVGAARAHVRVGWASITAGSDHSCALTTAGEAWCWGRNGDGQLGDGTTVPRSAPTRVAVDVRFRDLSAGGAHTCGVSRGDDLLCWGANAHGQLGNGSTAESRVPAPVAGPELEYEQVSAGLRHTCAISVEGDGLCWGEGEFGKLGTGDTDGRSSPSPVQTTLTFTLVAAGGDHTCALGSRNTTACWGRNDEGQLGTGRSSGFLTRPVVLGGILVLESVEAGNRHTCGVRGGGAGTCWGANAAGQVGDGTGREKTNPSSVERGLSFRNVSAGRRHSCGAARNGEVWCWGANGAGQLGDGTAVGKLSPVRAEAGETAFRQTAAGGFHTCGVTEEWTAWCWGSNAFGQLGDGTTSGSRVPVPVASRDR